MGFRHTALAALIGVACTACATAHPPVFFDATSSRAAPEAHQCVVAALVDADFRITESRAADGLVRARRAATERWSYLWTEYDEIEVWAFSRGGGSAGLQVTARTVAGDSEREPSEEVRALAREVAGGCG